MTWNSLTCIPLIHEAHTALRSEWAPPKSMSRGPLDISCSGSSIWSTHPQNWVWDWKRRKMILARIWKRERTRQLKGLMQRLMYRTCGISFSYTVYHTGSTEELHRIWLKLCSFVVYFDLGLTATHAIIPNWSFWECRVPLSCNWYVILLDKSDKQTPKPYIQHILCFKQPGEGDRQMHAFSYELAMAQSKIETFNMYTDQQFIIRFDIYCSIFIPVILGTFSNFNVDQMTSIRGTLLQTCPSLLPLWDHILKRSVVAECSANASKLIGWLAKMIHGSYIRMAVSF